MGYVVNSKISSLVDNTTVVLAVRSNAHLVDSAVDLVDSAIRSEVNSIVESKIAQFEAEVNKVLKQIAAH